jgi:hypothetical protein
MTMNTPDYKAANITSKEFNVCQMFKVNEIISKIMAQYNEAPKLKYHAIQMMPTALANNQLQHVIVYGCQKNVTFVTNTWDCSSEQFYAQCNIPLIAFDMGSGGVALPREVGMEWGSGDSQMVMMVARHQLVQNVTSNVKSSIKVYFTGTLRPNDMGIMFLGENLNAINIPGNMTSFTLNNTCKAECTNKMPTDGIKLLMHFFHGNRLLKKIRTEITTKNGQVDNTSIRNDNFDWRARSFRGMRRLMSLMPGDTLNTVCEYNSSLTSENTFGGLSARNEMCMAAIAYYPKKNGLAYCTNPAPCIPNTQ